jgi:hypothetical protein
MIMPGRRTHFEATDSSAETASKLNDFTGKAALLSLSLGERVGVRASVVLSNQRNPLRVCDSLETAKNLIG